MPLASSAVLLRFPAHPVYQLPAEFSAQQLIATAYKRIARSMSEQVILPFQPCNIPVHNADLYIPKKLLLFFFIRISVQRTGELVMVTDIRQLVR